MIRMRKTTSSTWPLIKSTIKPGTSIQPTLLTSLPTLQCRALSLTLLPWRPNHTPLIATTATIRNFSTTPSLPSGGQEEGLIKRGWQKLATLVSAFMTGTKGLYKDVKAMNDLKRRHRLVISEVAPQRTGNSTTDFGFNRTEFQFIYQTQKDLWKMLPTIVLFFVPFFGYFVPLVVFMYPHRMLSSHFLTEEQKAQLINSTSSLRSEHLNYLLSNNNDNDDLTKKFKKLETIFERLEEEKDATEPRKGGEGEDMESNIQRDLARYSLREIKTSQLERLCGAWGVSEGIWPRLLPWLRGSALRSRLEQHLRYIFTTDCLLHIEGGTNRLSKDDLQLLCLERCIMSGDEKEMEFYLKRWITISTQFQEVQPYLLALLPLHLHSRTITEQEHSSTS